VRYAAVGASDEGSTFVTAARACENIDGSDPAANRFALASE